MKNDKYRGYIVEDDRDGDSDGFHRNVIKRPDGTVVRDGVYDYCLMHVINSLPDLTAEPDTLEVKFNWKHSSNKPADHLPLVCMTNKGSIMTLKASGDERTWKEHYVRKYNIKYWAYQHEINV
jgi:hypothetical protein